MVLIAELVGVGQVVHDVAGPAGAGRVVKAEPRAEVVQTHPAFGRGLDLDVPDHDARLIDRHGELHIDLDVRPGGVAPGVAAGGLEGVAGRIGVGRVDVASDVLGGGVGRVRGIGAILWTLTSLGLRAVGTGHVRVGGGSHEKTAREKEQHGEKNLDGNGQDGPGKESSRTTHNARISG